ncbi:MAG: hypothetical protein L6Q53_13950 [Candidatus Brocadia sinica]|nr:hypothetical protein [Candidatus Brocadia sinica]NUO05370.1 hypothetical protein [Candidatus Brocadia sinica]
MSRNYIKNIVCGKYWLIGLLWILSIGMCVGGSAAGHEGLSLEARIACQGALEEVYWKHTIWPEANTSPKPQLSEVMSEEELRKKVTETLRMSKALEEVWHHPITGNDLQAEMERMAETTKDAETLHELWSALGNDPQLIAEVLARQTLVERLIHDWYAFDERFHGRLKKQAMRKVESLLSIKDMKDVKGAYHEMEWRKGRNSEDSAKDYMSGDALEFSEDEWQDAIGRLSEIFGQKEGQIPLGQVSALQEDAERFYVVEVLQKETEQVKVAVVEWRKVDFDKWWSRVNERFAPETEDGAFNYRLPEIAAAPLPYAPNAWSPTSASQVPSRSGHTAVWTGTYMIVWGGYGGTTYGYQSNGGRYNPSTNSWQQMSLANAPSGRTGHSAVWTGTEMIIWGGNDSAGNLNTGGRYNLSANTWTPTATTGAPSGRRYHTAVWTGTQMIVWGGWNGSYLNTGGRYSPSANTWTSTATTGAPSARRYHTALWTGTQMIVWGGWNGTTYFNTGGRYSPSTNTWAATNTSGVPGARELHTAVWTGTEMIVWGGYNGNYLNTGGRYNPSANTWTPTLSSPPTPSGRRAHTAVWTGTQMIVWGGVDAINHLGTGGRYSPSTDSWISTATTGAPSARQLHTAVWTGTQMIVWGGYGSSTYLNTGGRYDPSANTWTPTSTTTLGAPGARYWHTAVWTGTQMIVWGGWNGTNYFNTGGRYSPSTNTWSATSITNAPSARGRHTVVWTGTQMIVWGGVGITGHQYWNTGGRYNPSTNTWTPTTTTGAPSAAVGHTAVWTGTEMIVWGGANDVSYFNTGGQYNPTTDTWVSTTTTNAPSGRGGHTAVWANGQMIVWGGVGTSGYTSTGGRYHPSSLGGAWNPTSTSGAPSARHEHTAVWTGTEMIVWGGQGFSSGSIWLYTGYRYNPSTDTWTSTTTSGAPSGRSVHTAVWAGTQMIVWGGWSGSASYFNTGGRYNPSTNTWTPTATTGAPSRRYGHTAVWTGTQMIVWGGWNGSSALNTGGLYTP